MYFHNCIGQNDLKRHLLQSIGEGIVPHAQLFAGREGTGALNLALAYARYLHCTHRQADDACGACPSCLKLDQLSHPDLHFVFPIINKKGNKEAYCDDFLPEWRTFLRQTPYGTFAQWLESIDANNAQGLIYARESDAIQRKLVLRAYESEYKIMIIWLPEKMHESAANKLLKLLEEPYEKTLFLLVAEQPDKIIPTIRSRVQTLFLPPIDDRDLFQALGATHPPFGNDDLALLLRLVRGSYSEALRIINTSTENDEYLDLFITIMRNSWSQSVINMKTKAEQFAALGRNRQKAFFAYAQHMIRENFILRLQSPPLNYLNQKEAAFSAKFAPYVHSANILELTDELALAEQQIEANGNPRMIFFDLSMKIAVLLKRKEAADR
jgi:DNA polymerase-3 subunit delta'